MGFYNCMPKNPKQESDGLQVDSLVELLDSQDAQMRALFTKAINYYVCPGAEDLDDRVKQDRLKQAVEESLH